MPDFSGLILLLLPLAAATGWFAARNSRPAEDQEPGEIHPDYARGLSHLVNNDPDQAIASFLSLLKADNATVDMHLALGSLYRRRGEVDRALKIHLNLVERPELQPAVRNQARFELARDYQTAGVLDRAEGLLLELANQGMFLESALRRLLQIYESEKDWSKAIDTARWLASAKGKDMGVCIAHYHCELALQAQRQDDDKRFRAQLKKALAADFHSVRARLLKAASLRAAGRPQRALELYRQIAGQRPAFAADLLTPLREVTRELAAPERLIDELQTLYQHSQAPQVLLALAAEREHQGGDSLPDLLSALAEKPNWIGLHAVLDRDWPELDPAMRACLARFARALEGPLRRAPRYQCRHCGYAAGLLNWQCPSCRRWDTTEPLDDLHFQALDEPVRGASAIADQAAL